MIERKFTVTFRLTDEGEPYAQTDTDIMRGDIEAAASGDEDMQVFLGFALSKMNGIVEFLTSGEDVREVVDLEEREVSTDLLSASNTKH